MWRRNDFCLQTMQEKPIGSDKATSEADPETKAVSYSLHVCCPANEVQIQCANHSLQKNLMKPIKNTIAFIFLHILWHLIFKKE